MARDIFELASAASKELLTVKLGKVLDDGQPCAVRIAPLRLGDFIVLGGTIPVPSGRSSEEWSPSERTEYYDYLRKLMPVVCKEARHVQQQEDGSFVESWIPLRVITENRPPNRQLGELTVEELDSLGDAVVRIGNAVLYDTDQGGGIGTLPAQVEAEDFLVGAGRDSDPGVGGGDVRGDAPRVAPESA